MQKQMTNTTLETGSNAATITEYVVQGHSNAATVTESVAQWSECRVTAGAATTRTDTVCEHNLSCLETDGRQRQHIRIACRDEGSLVALCLLRLSKLIKHSLNGQLRPPSLYLVAIDISGVFSHR